MTTLSMTGITKRFGSFCANENVDLEVSEGEVHGLLGENGAGKTTLMNILFGLLKPDGGSVSIDGKPVSFKSPRDATRFGIGMVHQHFQLVPTMTVAENMSLFEAGSPWQLDLPGISDRILELSERYRLNVDPSATVAALSVGQQQRVEILKLLYRDARILVLDEPTAVLTPLEWKQISKLMRQLVEDGRSIIFISHKLKEQFEVSDSCTVLRRGRSVGTRTMTDTHDNELIEMMVGQALDVKEPRKPAEENQSVLLNVRSLSAQSDSGLEVLRDVSFEIRAGETVGIAGVDGNGQEELVDALIGILPLTQGEVEIDGAPAADMTLAQWRARGGAVITADRHSTGVALDLDLEDNLLITERDNPHLVRFKMFRRKAVERHVDAQLTTFKVQAAGPDVQMRQLSGGNQQKVVLARELNRFPRIVIAAQPTRGLDVGTAQDVHGRIKQHREKGGATLLISTELDEIIELSDRIAVMSRGKIVDIVRNDESFDFDYLASLMAGGDAK